MILVDRQDYRWQKRMSTIDDPAHPGEVLRERLPEGMTVTQAARELPVSRVTLSWDDGLVPTHPVGAAREAGDSGFAVLIACACNDEAHVTSSSGSATARCSRRA